MEFSDQRLTTSPRLASYHSGENEHDEDPVKGKNKLWNGIFGKKPSTPRKGQPHSPPGPRPLLLPGGGLDVQGLLRQNSERSLPRPPLNSPRNRANTSEASISIGPRRVQPHRPIGPRPLPPIPGGALNVQALLSQISEQTHTSQSEPSSPRDVEPSSPRRPVLQHLSHAREGQVYKDIKQRLQNGFENINDVKSIWHQLLDNRKRFKIKPDNANLVSLKNRTLSEWSKLEEFTSADAFIVVSVLVALKCTGGDKQPIINLIDSIRDFKAIETLLEESTGHDVADFIIAIMKFEHGNQPLTQYLFNYLINKLRPVEEGESEKFTIKNVAKIALGLSTLCKDESIIAAFQAYVLHKAKYEPNSFRSYDFVKLLCAFAYFEHYEKNLIEACLTGILNRSAQIGLNGTHYTNIMMPLGLLQPFALATQQPVDSRLIEPFIERIVLHLHEEGFFESSDLAKIAWGIAMISKTEKRFKVIRDLLVKAVSHKIDDKYLNYIHDAVKAFPAQLSGVEINWSPEFNLRYHAFELERLERIANQQDVAVHSSRVGREISVWSPPNSPRIDTFHEVDPPLSIINEESEPLSHTMAGLTIGDGGEDEGKNNS